MTQDNASPLSATELKEFRSLVAQASSRPGYTMSRIAQELGFADASPLRKILRNPKRTTSRDRFNRLRGIVGKSAGGSSSTSGASTTGLKSSSKTLPAAKPAVQAKGGTTLDQEAWVSKTQAKDFERRVEQLRQSGWTVDALAKRLGYQHGRSLRKTLASGNVRQRVFNTIMGLSAKSSGASAASSRVPTPAKPAKVAQPSRPAASAKTTSAASPAPKFSDRPVSGGVTTYLESARRHLDRARTEVERASSSSQLLQPGLRALMDELDDLGRRLEL